MKNMRIMAMVILVLSIAALACSLGGAGQIPQALSTIQAAATEAESGTPAPKATTGKATPAPADSGGDALSLQDRESGLDKLKSYRAQWKAEWKATDSSSTESISWDWAEEYSSDPQGLHWVMRLADPKSKGTNMEFWRIGDTTYMQTQEAGGKSQCISFSSSDPQSQLTKGAFNPSMLGSVNNAKYVGTETVNGVKAKHYKYDEKGFTLFAGAKVSGDIWVAVDDGYVVKETVNWSGVAGLFGAGSKAKGDGKWTWELSNINQPITIKPPEGCGGAAADIPIMKDATDKSSFGDTITYKSPSKLADVAEFYKKQMPAAGWKLSGEPDVSDEMATLEFKKGEQTASILLTIDEDMTQVLITIEK